MFDSNTRGVEECGGSNLDKTKTKPVVAACCTLLNDAINLSTPCWHAGMLVAVAGPKSFTRSRLKIFRPCERTTAWGYGHARPFTPLGSFVDVVRRIPGPL